MQQVLFFFFFFSSTHTHTHSYAPWCPACKQFSATWENFAEWALEEPSRNLRVGEVDVTKETSESSLYQDSLN